jgi:dephospho-CoA kinase
MKGSQRKVIGLTGGIASGKSTVGKALEARGFAHLDADAVARDIGAPGGAARPRIEQRFGTADRDRLREIVFADPQARKDLEALLHPLIREESARRMAALPGTGPIIYEAALLVETGRFKDLDGLIVVHAPKDVRKSRLIARNGWDELTADRVMDAQISDEDRLRCANWVVENTGTLKQLEAAVDSLLEKLKQLK